MFSIFDLRDDIIKGYLEFSRSFTIINAPDIRNYVNNNLQKEQIYCPAPLLQINPNYKQATDSNGTPVTTGSDSSLRLNTLCSKIFQINDKPLELYQHQVEAILTAKKGKSYVVTSGTGSGKSLTFFIPIFNRIIEEKEKELQTGALPSKRVRAIIIYPMNALANSQKEEIDKFLSESFFKSITPKEQQLVPRVLRYTGQEGKAEREVLRSNPPDILLTNYMMLELMLIRYEDRNLIENCKGLEFVVLDELHTYRGRQGSDVAMLMRRLRLRTQDSTLNANDLICIGTSATMTSVDNSPANSDTATAAVTPTTEENRNSKDVVAQFAANIFGCDFDVDQVISETLERVTDPSKTLDMPNDRQALRDKVVIAAQGIDHIHFTDLNAFKTDPLAVWLETKISINENNGDLVRATPQSLNTIAHMLTLDAQVEEAQATAALKNFILYFAQEERSELQNLKNKRGKLPFAFKLHQFISGPSKVNVSLAPQNQRKISLNGQTYFQSSDDEATSHSDTNKYPWFEAFFCRDCGQEYLPVWITYKGKDIAKISPRPLGVIDPQDEVQAGFVCPVCPDQKFSGDNPDAFLPDRWFDPGQKLKKAHRDHRPVRMWFDLSGNAVEAGDPLGTEFWVIKGKYRICVRCAGTYSAQSKETNLLIGLSGEGRSSASTVISLLTLQLLFEHSSQKHKLLGFSDNRQDTALQAGHFNDFVNLLSFRAAVVRVLQQRHQRLLENAAVAAEEESTTEAMTVGKNTATASDEIEASFSLNKLVQALMQCLHFSGDDTYAAYDEFMDEDQNPPSNHVRDARVALAFSLKFRLLLELEDKRLYTCPSLEKLNLLQIDYSGLKELCTEEVFRKCSGSHHSMLDPLTPDLRYKLFKLFLNEVRRRMCIQSSCFSEIEQKAIKDRARSGHLKSKWLADDMWYRSGNAFSVPPYNLKPEKGTERRRSSISDNYREVFNFSFRSGINQMLSNSSVWKELQTTAPDKARYLDEIKPATIQELMVHMAYALSRQGILQYQQPKANELPIYTLDESCILWSFPADGALSNAEVHNDQQLFTEQAQQDIDEQEAFSQSQFNFFYRKLYLGVAGEFDPQEDPNTLSDEPQLPTVFALETHEHTAQVSSETRQELEQRFRAKDKDKKDWEDGHLGKKFKPMPLLFCSPTMELGIDIADLNYVYLRNVPPTAANYVQRAGRAGRSGQAALVMTYCAAQSAHDQWFFKRPQEMVQGTVREPTLDLSNEALLLSHLHSLWLSIALSLYDDRNQLLTPIIDATATAAKTEQMTEDTAITTTCTATGSNTKSLPHRVFELLAVNTDNITHELSILKQVPASQHSAKLRELYPIRAEYQAMLNRPEIVEAAIKEGYKLMSSIFDSTPELKATLPEEWLDGRKVRQIMHEAFFMFNSALDRWRELYVNVSAQKNRAHNSRTENSKRQWEEAYNQLSLLIGDNPRVKDINRDFYLYRYLANQGFLPGYSFPAMPLLAWLTPTNKLNSPEVLSRARFIGLSEFGPRNVIYHNGEIYQVNRIKLNAESFGADRLQTQNARYCPNCGFMTFADSGTLVQTCPQCDKPMDTHETTYTNLYQISVMGASPINRITVADENRRAQGFDIRTYYRFTQNQSTVQCPVLYEGQEIAKLTYASAAEVYRINAGWKNSKDKTSSSHRGFNINPLSGYWESETPADEAPSDVTSTQNTQKPRSLQTIVPYVKDTRNILLLEPNLDEIFNKVQFTDDATEQDLKFMATLQAALSRAITQHFQIESSELFVEPLPDRNHRRLLLIYESGEGGSGVLSRIAKGNTLASIADSALKLMHYDKGNDQIWDLSKQQQYNTLPKITSDPEHPNPQGTEHGDTCFTACYNCLLSYQNQMDHPLLDRQDHDVYQFLARLSQCSLGPQKKIGSGLLLADPPSGTETTGSANGRPNTTGDTSTASGTNTTSAASNDNALLGSFMVWAISNGYTTPDDAAKRFKLIDFEFAAVYTNCRCLISFRPVDDSIKDDLDDMGWTCVELGTTPEQWAQAMEKHPELKKS